MADARTVIAQHNALDGLAAREAITLPNDLRPTFEAGGFADTSARAEAERQAIVAIAGLPPRSGRPTTTC